MLPIIIGLVGVGLIALRAIDALRNRVMTRKAENLLCEVAPATLADGKDKPACGPTCRNIVAKEEFPPLDGITTLYELFKRSASRYPNNPCLGTRKHVRIHCSSINVYKIATLILAGTGRLIANSVD